MSRLISAFIFSMLILLSCQTKEKNENKSKPLEREDLLKLKQYQVQGKEIYQTRCASCHHRNGEGLAALYPPLKASDYLLEDLKRAVCIIKNGQAEKIVVNGRTYTSSMPENSNLTPLEIAEVITYVTNEWGNTKGLTDVTTVENWLSQCK